MLDRICKAKDKIAASCGKIGRRINIMEVCGTHTAAIFRSGLRQLLPDNLNLLSGPGCPVCVTEQGFIDTTIALADRDDCIIATYGDMIRVPGKDGSLETRPRSNVKIVLSSDQAIQLAEDNPDKTVVFIAVGFETTAPATAVAISEAQKRGLANFCILCSHKLVVPAMEVLVTVKNHKIDAFLCPGHVSVIIGSDAYLPIVERHKRPCVVAGFEPVQIIEALAEICRQLSENDAKLESVYDAAVTPEGNITAQKLIAEFFEPCDGLWRGLGVIPKASLRLKDKYRRFDAIKKLDIEQVASDGPDGCLCGQVLCGLVSPADCQMFAKKCTPDNPVGPCMVSSEGACSAWYKYGRKKTKIKTQNAK